LKHIQFLWLLIAVLVLARVAYYFAQPDMSTDHLSQMAMAQNFMDGNGFSFKYLNAGGEIYYTTHIQWPPLYPFLIAMLGFVTGNLLLSSFILQIAVLILLVITWRKTFNLFSSFLTDEAYYYFISFLLISTSILNNINTILVFALLLLSVSLYYTFTYPFKERSKLNLALSALFAALLFWTHYSYFFVAFYPALVLLIIYLFRKDRKYFFAGAGSFMISLVISSGVLIYNFVTTSNINYMDNPDIWDAGFFPEHLLLTDPFFINTFFKTSYLFDYILKAAPDLVITLAFQFASLLVLAAIIILFNRLRKNKTLPFDKTSELFIPFFVIIALIIVFLLYFSLRYYEIPRPNWTHIGDPRYLSAVYMSVAAIVVMLIFNKAGYISSKLVKGIKTLMIFLIFINLAINIYITADHWGKYSFTKNVYEVPDNDLGELFDNINLEKSKGSVPVFIDNNLTVRSVRISQYAGAAVIGSDELNGIQVFPENMVFFFILPEAEQYREEDYQTLEWSRKFNLKNIGMVYNNLNLYKVNN
jgi:hypothetical protein